ncbi:hypothetical protein BD309DRAFT_960924 [Dichomitus squalens]|uniref:Uncharacterized protein n=1 Tax=Dichomitus squalens TaxID=114155 RepID=A0A4Q9QA10_9APHY|nr:hypothetical protein BD309DRAFT_960924 [Dichomitus squalens]TBU64060.1 hypothetical protein BD310DRAFT_915275 [Dichomitus squalens]
MSRDRGLSEIFQAAAILTGPAATSEARPTDLKGVLLCRLADYYAYVGNEAPQPESSLEGAQLSTAVGALSVLEQLHGLLRDPDEFVHNALRQSRNGDEKITPENNPTLIGSRDMALIRTLTSIVFKWGVEPLLQRIVSAIPSTSRSHLARGASIIDLTGLPHEYSVLCSLSSRLLTLPLCEGTASPLSKSVVTATILNQHLSDLLLPCIVSGWLPKSLASDSMPTGDAFRPQVMYLLSRLPVSQVISAVGQTLAKAPSSLLYARRACTFILSRQLMRPEGIRGLCESVFAEEDVAGDDAPLQKLEHVARVFNTVPVGMKDEDYSKTIIPRMLLLLSLEDRALPATHRRAIAFSLSRMLTNDDSPELQKAATVLALSSLHNRILFGSGDLSTDASLRIIQVLLTNTDPSPHLLSALFTPIVPSLYALYVYLKGTRASDPLLRESLQGYLGTWGRLLGSAEVISTLWRVIDGEGGNWRVDVAGNISRTEDAPQDATSLSLFTPESLKQAEEAGDLDVDANILGLRPDPVQFVSFIGSLKRADVSSELFVRLLEGYRELRSHAGADPLKTLLYLQLILQMQKQLSTDDNLGILKKPEHMLSFIKHALENPRQSEPSQAKTTLDAGLRMESLRIVPDEAEDDELEDGDSDDEEEGTEGLPDEPLDDITSTAVKLLLSVLEANPDLSARNAPILNDIFSLLEPLSKASNEELRSLTREARMVMTARLASTSDTAGDRAPKAAGDAETPQETYQKALKLLQDPLLPVRAHGLMLLRQLVSARKRSGTDGLSEPPLDRALVPGILSIFMQSIQDDDSYMFLNAVQGLSAMVDGFGKDVLRGLVNTYAGGLDSLSASTISQHDVDMRTRVGEALGQVIQRCGEALPSYAPLLVPALFQVVRTTQFPTVLRTSAISLLAQCIKTNALAVLPYIVDLADAMVDLLQIESAAAAPHKPSLRPKRSADTKSEREEAHADADADQEGQHDTPPAPPTMDTQPTSTNTKFPPLRRAALHFLSLLIQACTSRVYETGDAEGLMLPPGAMKRARTTLGYVAATDADDVVRVMARETTEGLDQLAEALIGL